MAVPSLQSKEPEREQAVPAVTPSRLFTSKQSWVLLFPLILSLIPTLIYVSYDPSSMIGYAGMGLVTANLYVAAVYFLDKRVARVAILIVAGSLLYVFVGVWGCRAVLWLKGEVQTLRSVG